MQKPVTIYVDGAGGENSGYGYVVPETGRSEYVTEPGLTNNQAEYKAVLIALDEFANLGSPVMLYSDSKVVVSQINHEYAINNTTLREMARKVWLAMAKYEDIQIRWIPRKENVCGKMLGS